EAQVDRFLFKVLVDYPTLGEEASVVGRSLRPPEQVQVRLSMSDLESFQRAAQEIFVDREVVAYAVQLVDATRNPERYGLADLKEFVQYGASPRGAIGMVQAGQALALLRGRRHVLVDDVRDLAFDVLRHRLVLSYDALSDGVTADDILTRVVDTLSADTARLAESDTAA
ncbi:MAG: MoxR-like ATPase, partial [Solirubrobacteraceae bacterium]|nr:MoxR-like ATPase [Solirubrobacteraceae bacterium]